MKSPLIRSTTAMSLIALSAFLASPASGQTLINYNFNSLTPGALNGQDGWSASEGANGAQVATTPTNAGGGGTLGLTNGLINAGMSAWKSFFTAGSVTSSSIVTLTFDAIQDSAPTIAQFGISTGGQYPNFGIWNGTMAIRSDAGTFIAKTPGGFDVAPINDHWYSFKSVWDLNTQLATLAYKDLTNGDTGYTQLYFNAGQTQSTVSLGAITPSTWTHAYVRVGKTGVDGVGYGTGYLDNLSVVVVPEPHVVGLAALGLGSVLLRCRRRSGSLRG